MAFSELTIAVAWKRAGDRCECERTTHNHDRVRCNKEVLWESRGREGHGAWEGHHYDGNSNNDVLSNCRIFCWNPCHKATL